MIYILISGMPGQTKMDSIGTCYGDVVGRKFIYKEEETDQMDYVLRQLRENPYSRRIMTNLYQFEYLHSGALDPCCYSMTYSVTKEPGRRTADFKWSVKPALSGCACGQ